MNIHTSRELEAERQFEEVMKSKYTKHDGEYEVTVLTKPDEVAQIYRCGFPNSSHFHIVIRSVPGCVTITGDLGDCVFVRSYNTLSWLEQSIRDVHYISSKMPREFKVEEGSMELVYDYVHTYILEKMTETLEEEETEEEEDDNSKTFSTEDICVWQEITAIELDNWQFESTNSVTSEQKKKLIKRVEEHFEDLFGCLSSNDPETCITELYGLDNDFYMESSINVYSHSFLLTIAVLRWFFKQVKAGKVREDYTRYYDENGKPKESMRVPISNTD